LKSEVSYVFSETIGPYKYIFEGDEEDYEDEFCISEMKMQLFIGEQVFNENVDKNLLQEKF